MEEVRKSIDARKGVLAAAQKAVEGGSYPFIKAGSFADQVKNLEDILFVALTDKDLSERESHLISEFGRLIGVSQGQLDQLVAETSRRCDSAKHDITCPCSQLASAQARFCASCGQPLTSPDAVTFQVEFDLPKAGYAIEFSESTAAGFATALELSKATRTMQTATKNKKTWYLVSFPPNQFADMVPLGACPTLMKESDDLDC